MRHASIFTFLFAVHYFAFEMFGRAFEVIRHVVHTAAIAVVWSPILKVENNLHLLQHGRKKNERIMCKHRKKSRPNKTYIINIRIDKRGEKKNWLQNQIHYSKSLTTEKVVVWLLENYIRLKICCTYRTPQMISSQI